MDTKAQTKNFFGITYAQRRGEGREGVLYFGAELVLIVLQLHTSLGSITT